MKQLGRHLTFANVVACIALFVALGGASYAAFKLPKNSVGTKQIKNNAITAAKIKNGAVTGGKINVSSLGTVPSATHAASADTASHATSADTASRAGSATSADDASALDGLPSSAFAASSQILHGSATIATEQRIIAFPGGLEILTKAGDQTHLIAHFPGGDKWSVSTATSSTDSLGPLSTPIAYNSGDIVEQLMVRDITAGDAWQVSCERDTFELDSTCVAVGA